MTKTEAGDEFLLKSVVKGDRSAFSILYRRHLKGLLRCVYLACGNSEMASDILQELFLKLWENKENIGNIACFKTYIFRCAKNMLIDNLKERKRFRIY